MPRRSLIWLALELVGLAVALFGEGAIRWLGVAGFVGGSLMHVALAFASKETVRSTDAPRLASVERSGVFQPAFVFDFSAGRQLWTAIGFASAVPVLLVLVVFADELPAPLRDLPQAFGFGFLAATAVGVALLTWAIRRAATGHLALLREGIEHRTGVGATFVPWRAIERAGEFSIWQEHMLGLKLSDPSAAELGRGRSAMGLNRRLYGYDLAYPLRAVAAPRAIVTRAIARYVSEPERRGAIGTEAERRALLSLSP